MRKFINFGFLILMLCGIAAAQETAPKDEKMKRLNGTVKGTIVIKEISGNNLGNFNCSNLRVTVSEIGGNEKWARSRTAGGNIRTQKCSYLIPNVPSEDQFIVGIAAQFPKGCDLKIFKVENSLPTKIKGGETFTYHLVITQIKCEIVK